MVADGDKSRKFAFMEIRFKLGIFRIGTTCINMATQNKYGVKDYRIRHRMLPYMDCVLQYVTARNPSEYGQIRAGYFRIWTVYEM